MKYGKLYSYIGPEELFQKCYEIIRKRIRLPNDIFDWIRGTKQRLAPDNTVTATFIIDDAGALWIADRHAEHVACAQDGAVRSAGEMTFRVDGERVTVINVTNQSTGYVPEPGSWPAVCQILELIGVDYPEYFNPAYEFRRCDACSTVNIIKDDWFVCSACGRELSPDWNFD